jgi:hypothetical protein
MTITDKLNAFALLKVGFTQAVVSKMFGISTGSVSHLANCLNRSEGQVWRYPDVHNEWRRLGEEDFLRAYLTEEVYLKAQQMSHNVDGHAEDDRTQLYLTSNPRADSCSHGLIGSFDLGTWRARIDFVECDDPDLPPEKKGPIGWRYAQVGQDDFPDSPYVGVNPNDEPIRADGIWMPWRTSAECFDYCHLIMGLKSPRRMRRK